jgi:hypothetical protein
MNEFIIILLLPAGNLVVWSISRSPTGCRIMLSLLCLLLMGCNLLLVLLLLCLLLIDLIKRTWHI